MLECFILDPLLIFDTQIRFLGERESVVFEHELHGVVAFRYRVERDEAILGWGFGGDLQLSSVLLVSYLEGCATAYRHDLPVSWDVGIWTENKDHMAPRFAGEVRLDQTMFACPVLKSLGDIASFNAGRVAGR
jgi:hypothetical protein